MQSTTTACLRLVLLVSLVCISAAGSPAPGAQDSSMGAPGPPGTSGPSGTSSTIRCYPVNLANDSLPLTSAFLVISVMVKVPHDGDWVEYFDEEHWLNHPVEPGKEENSRTFLTLNFTNYTIEAKLRASGELEIALPSGVHKPLTLFPVTKWLRLLIALDLLNSQVQVRVGRNTELEIFPMFDLAGNSTEEFDGEKEEEEGDEEVSSSSGMMNAGPINMYSTIWQLNPREVCREETTWVYLKQMQLYLADNFDSLLPCESHINGTSLLSHDVADKEPLSVLCKDESTLIKLESRNNYFEHRDSCKKFQGSILTKEDVVAYANKLKSIIFMSSIDGEFISWLEGQSDVAESFKSWCSVLMRNGSLSSLPCLFPLNFSICKVQTSLPIHLYGKIAIFDRQYVLISELDGSWKLKGSSSFINFLAGEWLLESNLHKAKCNTSNVTLPLVRNIWQCGASNITLGLSSCSTHSFSCSSGQCLPKSSRCDGVAECEDESDEENCDLILKDAGYDTLIQPPSLAGEEKLRMKYEFDVWSIAPMQTTNFYAEVTLMFIVYWRDPRLTVWNPVTYNDFDTYNDLDCDEIWSPMYLAADGYKGDWVSLPAQFTDGCKMELLYDHPLNESTDDPYMGRFIGGSSLELVYTLSGIFTVPCRFDLRKYPFGDQKCELNIWVDATEFDEIIYERFHDELEDDVHFYGRRDVREFWVSRTWRREVNYNQSVSLMIELKSLYGYHVLNSYLTSFLILLISFSTAAFRVEDFNERVMVSLTSLLVLTALFTQANSSSVQTSYLKLLDVWYAALIAFSFLIVLANTFLNSYHHKLDAEKKLNEKCYDEKTIIKKVKVLNYILFGSLSTVFCSFMFFYILSVANVI
ncbi:uncharacterized protein LOC108675465 [Hyalella azteca]|uniref:Uncharacterized protein LOC108675465 n=1 Tax=Hyalella azteca TaxID=294128 RepID=A0A8B7NYY1_HYAAZ|nr:uncharacterized protein LOC108675465 [Hyalella azteca]